MVLKEVIDFTTLYICVSIVREKSIHYSLFTSVRKVQHCTGYPLIQVEIVSVCKKSLCVLAGFPKFFVDFLVLGVCGHFLTVSCVGAGAGTGPSAAGASFAILQYLHFLPFFLKNTELDTEEVFGVVM